MILDQYTLQFLLKLVCSQLVCQLIDYLQPDIKNKNIYDCLRN